MSSDNSLDTNTPEQHAKNSFTHGSLPLLFVKTALPIIFVMSMNGLLSIVDAIFLGTYVGPDALAAVTLMFPIFMLVVALSTLVSNGLSSMLARHLGARELDKARALFSGAHGLALTTSALLILAFLLVGNQVALMTAGGIENLATQGAIYLRIMIFATPLMFVLSVHSDTLRNEGFAPVMAGMSLLVSLANILFNYIFIAIMELGVAGSAYGTVLAQATALVVILIFRQRGPSQLKPSRLLENSLLTGWRQILALGAPQSLNFLGMSIISTATITALQIVNTPHYAQTITAYGIITRMMTFYFLPLLGLANAMQSITGNNYGASLWHRSNASLRIAMGVALIYSLSAQCLFMVFAAPLGQVFVDDQAVISEVARILPMITLMMFCAGPVFMIATYFQTIGDAPRAAILGLSKTYLFMLPLLFTLPMAMGEEGIWLTSPLAEAMLLATTGLLLFSTARTQQRKWGLFMAPQKARS